MIKPLTQNVLIERDEKTSNTIIAKTGVILPSGSIEDEGLIYGTVLVAPKDQNMLIDKGRALSEYIIKESDYVWYSKFSACRILDDRKGKEGNLLDIVPLEDLRAVVIKEV